ncbi:hypothetical protein [Novosphingobium panipatense]|uniref:hypothetical protein n=1 Tax=Novosphingobium panipatense TaxID=428991 RepID=UPI00360C8E5B
MRLTLAPLSSELRRERRGDARTDADRPLRPFSRHRGGEGAQQLLLEAVSQDLGTGLPFPDHHALIRGGLVRRAGSEQQHGQKR